MRVSKHGAGLVVLGFVHFVLALLYSWLKYLQFWRHLTFPSSVPTPRRKAFKSSTGVQELVDLGAGFEKRPAHVSFLLNEGLVSRDDIAHLSSWAIALGINYISFWDPKGLLKDQKSSLVRAIREHNSTFFGPRVSEFPVEFNSSESGPSPLLHRISFLSSSDGRNDIVKAARELCRQDGTPRGPLTTEHVRSQLHVNCPDPDLLINFGGPPSLNGYLVYQIAVSEIVQVDTHVGISCEKFVSAIEQYSHCAQRFGK